MEGNNNTPVSIDEYILKFHPEIQEKLNEFRKQLPAELMLLKMNYQNIKGQKGQYNSPLRSHCHIN